MKKEDKTDKLDTVQQQKNDLRANITLLSGWQQAHANGSENFVFGLARQGYAMHVRPGTKPFEKLGELIETMIEQEGADLIMLG